MRNIRYEIYPTKAQVEVLLSWISICRQQYNSALLDHQNHYRLHQKGLSRTKQQKQLVKDKEQYHFLNNVPSQPLQETLFRLQKSFTNFFEKRAKYPKLKTAKDYRSITFTQFGIGTQTIKDKNDQEKVRIVRYAASLGTCGALCLSKLGDIRMMRHRNLPGRVHQVIIKQERNGRWYASFSVTTNDEPQTHVFDEVGIDQGIKKFAVLSTGEAIENPKYLRQQEKGLKRDQRRLSRKKKGSNNYKKQLEKIKKCHTKVKNQRNDFLHKESHRLSTTYRMIAMEDLNVRGMIRNRKLSKSIQDAGWGRFRFFMAYKCERTGGTLIKVAPHYTSIDCSSCGNRVQKTLSIRTHVCPCCGLVMDRDVNAAINILKKAKTI